WIPGVVFIMCAWLDKKGNSSNCREGSSNNILRMEDNLPVNVQEYQELAKKLILKKGHYTGHWRRYSNAQLHVLRDLLLWFIGFLSHVLHVCLVQLSLHYSLFFVSFPEMVANLDHLWNRAIEDDDAI
ncbi:hypothetical protein ACJX0J_021784, partial [Zea mays]